jgi:hypothetical protein
MTVTVVPFGKVRRILKVVAGPERTLRPASVRAVTRLLVGLAVAVTVAVALGVVLAVEVGDDVLVAVAVFVAVGATMGVCDTVAEGLGLTATVGTSPIIMVTLRGATKVQAVSQSSRRRLKRNRVCVIGTPLMKKASIAECLRVY